MKLAQSRRYVSFIASPPTSAMEQAERNAATDNVAITIVELTDWITPDERSERSKIAVLF